MMMSSLPPLPKGAELRQFLSTVRMLLDNKRAEETLNLLAAAVAENEKAEVSARQAIRDLDAKRTEHNAAIAKERAEHDARLSQQQAAWNSEEARRRAALEADEAAIGRLKEQAVQDGKAAAALRRDLQQRLARMSELAA
jgi:hypothetical protein